jgi:hypothetical protein
MDVPDALARKPELHQGEAADLSPMAVTARAKLGQIKVNKCPGGIFGKLTLIMVYGDNARSASVVDRVRATLWR